MTIKIQKGHCMRLPHAITQQTFVLMKTSWDQDEYIRLIHASSRRIDQDLYIRLRDASSGRLEDVLKTSCKNVFKMFCKNVFKMFCKKVFKTSCKNVFKTSLRRLQDVLKMFSRRLPRSRVCLGHTSENFMVSVENLQLW